MAKLWVLVGDAGYPAAQHNRFIRDYLVFGMNSDNVRKECLKVGNDLTLQKARELAKAEESVIRHLQHMGAVGASIVNAVGASRTQRRPHSKKKGSQSGETSKCKRCPNGVHAFEKCSAKNAQCFSCKRTGHFSKACLSKKSSKGVHELGVEHEPDMSQYDQMSYQFQDKVFLGTIEVSVDTVMSQKEKALLEVKLACGPNKTQKIVMCKIDSGAETNILPVSVERELFPANHKLDRPTAKLTAYGGVNVPNLGSCVVYVQGPHQHKPVGIHAEVANVDYGPTIIGNISARKMNLIVLNWPDTDEAHNTNVKDTVKLYDVSRTRLPLTKEDVMREYKDVFTGIGRFPGKPYHIQLQLDPKITPVQHAPRQVPVHLQAAYRDQLIRVG